LKNGALSLAYARSSTSSTYKSAKTWIPAQGRHDVCIVNYFEKNYASADFRSKPGSAAFSGSIERSWRESYAEHMVAGAIDGLDADELTAL